MEYAVRQELDVREKLRIHLGEPQRKYTIVRKCCRCILNRVPLRRRAAHAAPRISRKDSVLADSVLVRNLRRQGVRIDRRAATLWFERGALSSQEMVEFARLANRGIRDIERWLQVPAAPRRARKGKIFYFISNQVEISHARRRTIFLPLFRVRNRSAPYLHETFHLLVKCAHCPLWFSEGMACYAQSYVSEHFGGYDGAIFTRGGNRGLDVDAAGWLSRREGKAVLPFLGAEGEPPSLFSDRHNVATPFYVLSQSLVKFIAKGMSAKLHGLATSRDFDRALEKATGKTALEWKKDWLASLANRRGKRETPPKTIV